jgi:poly-gamma-glutamate synthesis protein (capsule biosynthesis protein)
LTVFVPQELPESILDAVTVALAEHSDLFVRASSAGDADVQITLAADPGAALLAEWLYAVVAPFPTVTDEVAWLDVAAAWGGVPTGPFADWPLMMADDTSQVMAASMGEPSATASIEVIPADELLQRAWDGRPSWALVPFERLEPRWKVLGVDGASVLDGELDTAAYPLIVRVRVAGHERGVARLRELVGAPLTNREPARMTVLVMTGVTALTRCTAVTMEQQGVNYPAESIRDWLLAADLTHVSNEVSFAENCPPPTCVSTVMFCSSPRYIELFEDVNVDVVELTGNHLLDWGVEPMRNTLRMLEERGMAYFGGGWNLAQSQTPLTVTHGAHTFGFAGCNAVGPDSDWATDERPGSAPCPGYEYDWLVARIQGLRAQGVIPIVTLQYWEFDQYEPTAQQRVDFRALADAGAAFVSGSQAHHPQGFDFQNGVFIHYGLGNLFFDQTQLRGYRLQFIDRHVFYDGRHVSVELLTAMRDDYARPRPTTPEERQALLREAFAASGW